MISLSYLFAELVRRPGRTLTVLVSLALGVTLFLSLQAYASGYHQAARAPLAAIGADVAVQLQGKVPNEFKGIVFPHSTAPLHRDTIEAVQKIPGVESVSKAVLFWDFEPNRFLVVLGLDPNATSGPGRLRAAVLSGRFLNSSDGAVAVADATYARQNGISPGQTVVVAGQSFTIVGLVDTSRIGQVANANLYIPLADAQALSAHAPNVLSVFDFRPDDANILFLKVNQAQTDTVIAAVSQLLGPSALVSSARSFDETLGETFLLVDRFGWLVGLAGLFVGMGVVLRAMVSNLWERRRDIAVMRAVGWRRSDILRQLIAEVLLLALAGSLAGLAMAELVTFGLNQTNVTVPVPWELSPTPHFLPGGAALMAVTISFPAQVDALSVAVVFALALLGSALAALALGRRAANSKPAEVLRNE
jgi:putative ABC transport system permease protein